MPYKLPLVCPEHYARILWRDIGHKALCPICLVSAIETRTRYGHENLRRRAVDFRKVAVDFRNGGVAGQMGQALNKPRKWSNHGTTGNKNDLRQVGAATFSVKPIPN